MNDYKAYEMNTKISEINGNLQINLSEGSVRALIKILSAFDVAPDAFFAERQRHPPSPQSNRQSPLPPLPPLPLLTCVPGVNTRFETGDDVPVDQWGMGKITADGASYQRLEAPKKSYSCNTYSLDETKSIEDNYSHTKIK